MRYMLLLAWCSYSACCTGGTIGSPTIMANGGNYSVSSDASQNWFAFETLRDGRVLFFGEGSSRTWIDRVDIYDTNFVPVSGLSEMSHRTRTLPAGQYYFSVTNRDAGVFSAYSISAASTADTSGSAGTFANPYLHSSGQGITYPKFSRVGYFASVSDGTVLIQNQIQGSGRARGYGIYDSATFDLISVAYESNTGSFSVLADKSYFIIAGAESNTLITVASTAMQDGAIFPVINRDYSSGLQDGRQQCIDAPKSCGIEPEIINSTLFIPVVREAQD